MALTTDQLKKYWDSANVLRKNLDAAEYKHIVLGLVFLKYVSDSFAERRDELSAAFSDPKSDRYKPDAKRFKAALDDRNYYKEVNVFWVPETSRWEVIHQNGTGKSTRMSQVIRAGMTAGGSGLATICPQSMVGNR